MTSTILLWLMMIASDSSSLPDPALTTLLTDIEAAQSFDYCAYTTQISDHDRTLAALDHIMANKNGNEDETKIASAIVISAGVKVALEHPTDCAETLAEGTKRFDMQMKTFADLMKGQNRYTKSRDKDIAEVQAKIAEMWFQDQIARQVYVALQTDDREGAAFWAWRLATAHTVTVDAKASALMMILLEEYDWIDRHRFGAKISEHAWLLVQHADDHPDFQKLALSRMEQYLENGGVKKANYAYLWDRVAINTGQKQRYGTQPVWECNEDGSLSLQPMEDPENVDARRAELDMKPMQIELDQMAANFCGS